MGHMEDAHVGPSPCTPLLHHVGGSVECAYEADRPAGNAPGGTNDIAGGAQLAEGKARAPATLVNQGGGLHHLENRV